MSLSVAKASLTSPVSDSPASVDDVCSQSADDRGSLLSTRCRQTPASDDDFGDTSQVTS